MVRRYDVYPQVDRLLVLFRLVVQPQDKCQYLQVVLAAFLYELRGKGVNPDDSGCRDAVPLRHALCSFSLLM